MNREWIEIEIDGLRLRLVSGEGGLRAIEFEPRKPMEGEAQGNSILTETERQLRAYFAGDLREFAIPLDLAGTPFQQRVWRELLNIPYGQTRSYSRVARDIGAPAAVRAVGAANGANPVPIIVPCHRVVGANGKLTGYGGGLPLKQRLLALERGSLFEKY